MFSDYDSDDTHSGPADLSAQLGRLRTEIQERYELLQQYQDKANRFLEIVLASNFQDTVAIGDFNGVCQRISDLGNTIADLMEEARVLILLK